MRLERATWAICVAMLIIVGAMPAHAMTGGGKAGHGSRAERSWTATSPHDRATFLPRREGARDVQELRPQSLPPSIIAWQVLEQWVSHRWWHATTDPEDEREAGFSLLSLHCQLTV